MTDARDGRGTSTSADGRRVDVVRTGSGEVLAVQAGTGEQRVRREGPPSLSWRARIVSVIAATVLLAVLVSQGLWLLLPGFVVAMVVYAVTATVLGRLRGARSDDGTTPEVVAADVPFPEARDRWGTEPPGTDDADERRVRRRAHAVEGRAR